MMLFIDNNTFLFFCKKWRAEQLFQQPAYSAFAFQIVLFSVKMESMAKDNEVKFVLDVAQNVSN